MSSNLAAIKESIQNQLLQSWPIRAQKVMNDYNSRAQFQIPGYILMHTDPSQAISNLVSYISHRSLWLFYDVLEANGIFPESPYVKRFEDCNEWHLRPDGVQPYGRSVSQHSAKIQQPSGLTTPKVDPPAQSDKPKNITPAPLLSSNLVQVSVPVQSSQMYTFGEIHTELIEMLSHGYPRSIGSIVNDWNSKCFMPDISFGCGGNPLIDVPNFLKRFSGVEAAETGLTKNFYVVLQSLDMLLSKPNFKWEDMVEWHYDSPANQPVKSIPSDQDKKNNYECPVCFGTNLDTIAQCGHVFCSTCVQQISNNSCPVCRAAMLPLKRIYFA